MQIQGAKGGGYEQLDSLRSIQTAQVLDLISEGEIGGLVAGLRSVYLDGVPVMNADGSLNFEEPRIGFMVGTQHQSSPPGFDSVQAEFGVAVTVTKASPITRSIVGEADAVRVTLSVQQLLRSTSGGDIKGAEFEFAIDVQSNGGGWVERHREVVKGKTTNPTKKATRISLWGGAPYEIRVRRLNDDSDSASTINAFQWDSYTQIRELRLRYPNSAMAGLELSARQFQRLPARCYDVLGLLVEVPSNYDPIARTYTGVWDGTFKLAWTDNPAWQFRDIAITKRYGAGDFVTAQMLDKWVLYEIARYCDGLVPDGRGGMEPRFTCHLAITSREQAMTVLRHMAGVFRAIVFTTGSQVHVMQDAPRDASMLFTPANVVDGVFTYQSAGDQVRHSVFIVSFNDRTQFGRRSTEVYSPDHLVRRFGVKELQLAPIGVWSRGQAQRLARWAAYAEEYETEVVAFKVGAEGALALPGEVFDIADPAEAGERLGGRVAAATVNAVTIDAPVTLRDGETYTLLIQHPDADGGYAVEERAVTNVAGDHQVLNVAVPFTAAAQPETTWILSSNVVEPTTWRCMKVAEVKGTDQFAILAMSHHPQRFDAVELGVAIEPRPTSRLKVYPDRPTDLTLLETLYLQANTPVSRVTIGWESAEGQTYRVAYRHELGSWVDMPESTATSVDVLGLGTGLFEVAVRSVNALGVESLPLTGFLALRGKYLPPADPTGGGYTVTGTGITIYWDDPTAVDFDYLDTELRMGDSYEDSVPLDTIADTRVSGTTYAWLRPAAGEYLIWIRHRDTSGNESVTPLQLPITVGYEELLAWGQIQGRPKLFRAVSRGHDETGGQLAAGLYNGETGALILAAHRSYAFARLDRTTGNPTFTGHYDVYAPNDHSWPHPGEGKGASDLAADIMASPVGTIIVIITNDEPAANRTLGGLPNALYWCGANRTVFEKLDFVGRSAYLLIGVAGIGEGNGWDSYSYGESGTQAWLDMSFQLVSGQLLMGGNKSSSNSLRDFHFTGDLNANSSLRLVARGNASFAGSKATKVGGVVDWDCDVYSPDGYVGGAFAGATPRTADAGMMFGLNTDPETDGSYTSIDAAIYCRADSVVEIYEWGSPRGTFGIYAPGDRMLVWYDGVTMRYSRNGVVMREVPWSTTAPLHFDSSFAHPGGVLADIHYGPLSSTAQAQAAADAAEAAAATAQANASTALGQINSMADDNVLSRLEKSRAIQDWNVLSNEQAGIEAQAANYAVTTERTNYAGAVNALGGYLQSLSPAWADLDSNTPINGATWRAYWFNAYTARQAVLDRISANAKARLGALATINAVNTDEIVDGAVMETYDLLDVAGAVYSNNT